jgi:hypothetical protein
MAWRIVEIRDDVMTKDDLTDWEIGFLIYNHSYLDDELEKKIKYIKNRLLTK